MDSFKPYRPFSAPPLQDHRGHIVADRQSVLDALIGDYPVTCWYTDADGVTSYRYVVPRAIERCKNGETIVRVWDTQRRAPRSFVLSRMSTVLPLN